MMESNLNVKFNGFIQTAPRKNKSCMDFQSVLSIDDYIDNINDKSCLIKSKNDIDQINQDLTTFLDLNQVVQFRYNDKVTLIKELEAIQVSRHQKTKDGLHQKIIQTIPTSQSTNKLDSIDLNIESTFKVTINKMIQALKINDLDFTDLTQVDDFDPTAAFSTLTPPPSPMVPPPPPPMCNFGFASPAQPLTPHSVLLMAGLPPLPPGVGKNSNVSNWNNTNNNNLPSTNSPPPPPPPPPPLPPPTFLSPSPPPLLRKFTPLPVNDSNSSAKSRHGSMNEEFPEDNKRKLTKLHWREVFSSTNFREDSIWNEITKAEIDKDLITNLFELKHVDFKPKKSGEGKKELIILDTKRSNMIVIGMTALPPPRVLKTAIIKMDNSVINKEGIEKLLTMLPTEEEKNKILEAQLANPDIQLGSAEFFLLNLSSISEIKARLELWVFKLDFEIVEREIAEHLMDLKNGMEELKKSKTFKEILKILKEIGNHLNSSDVKGFQLDYLSRVPEVKDTVHKHSLLQHLCSIILEKSTDTTDLYSDLGGLSRCSKVDWDDLSRKVIKLEMDCKASWDNLNAIAKNDSNALFKNNNPLITNLNDETLKLKDFLEDCEKKIKVLKLVHSRLMNRFKKFLMYLGYNRNQASEYKIKDFCKLISEFALEYKTVRDRLLQQKEKRLNKTKPHIINDCERFSRHLDNNDHNESRMNDILTNFDKIAIRGVNSCNTPVLSGSLPGIRPRTRIKQTIVPKSTKLGTDTEEDGIDSVTKTIMAVTKGMPPKKRILRKYNERKGTHLLNIGST